MNKAILVGNLASDVDSRTTSSGIPTCTFRLATQRRYTNQDGKREADFHTIVCWRGLAENCARYLIKGNRVAVEGQIQNRSYDAQDGTKRYVTEIIADNVEFLTAKGEAKPDYAAANDRPAPLKGEQMGFEEVDGDELPF